MPPRKTNKVTASASNNNNKKTTTPKPRARPSRPPVVAYRRGRITTGGALESLPLELREKIMTGPTTFEPVKGSHSPSPKATVPDILRWSKLCGDHMVLLILSSFVVVCANCHGTVRMSYKDPYGTYHWKKHRDMCNKRSELEVQYERMRNMRFGEPQIVPLISAALKEREAQANQPLPDIVVDSPSDLEVELAAPEPEADSTVLSPPSPLSPLTMHSPSPPPAPVTRSPSPAPRLRTPAPHLPSPSPSVCPSPPRAPTPAPATTASRTPSPSRSVSPHPVFSDPSPPPSWLSVPPTSLGRSAFFSAYYASSAHFPATPPPEDYPTYAPAFIPAPQRKPEFLRDSPGSACPCQSCAACRDDIDARLLLDFNAEPRQTAPIAPVVPVARSIDVSQKHADDASRVRVRGRATREPPAAHTVEDGAGRRLRSSASTRAAPY